jgi:hypothetical protein
MSVSCRFERSLLNHEENETIRATHHPAIYDHDVEALKALRVRLRQMRDKERTLTRQKQREVRGKAEPRGASFPGTPEHAPPKAGLRGCDEAGEQGTGPHSKAGGSDCPCGGRSARTRSPPRGTICVISGGWQYCS